MRKVLFMLTFMSCCLFMGLPAGAQNDKGRLTMSFKNETLDKALLKIEKYSQYKVLFTYDDVKNYKVNGEVKNKPVAEVMKFVLKNTPLEYVIDGKFIRVTLKEQEQFPVSTDASSGPRQTVSFRGRVVDMAGEPLPGAYVVVEGTKIATTTASDGSFVLQLPRGKQANVAFSFVGMKTERMSINANRDMGDLKVRLKDDTQLDEVVVTGVFNKARESYTGAVSTITKEDIKAFRGQNLLQTLKNADASLNFRMDNLGGSNPNNMPNINIRGNSSLPTNLQEFNMDQKNTVNTPLIILDGFEITLAKLMDYNDNEIENINILKDAAATAIYGSRGANGVIVVTTRQPEQGHLRVSADMGVTLEVPDLTSYDVLNAREKLELEKLVGMYDGSSVSNQTMWDEVYRRRLNAVNSGTDTDWLGKPLRNGVGQRYNLRMEGGSNEFRWSATVGYNNVAGAMKDSFRQTFNGSITLMYNYKNFVFRNYTNMGITSSSESKYGSFSQYVSLNPYEAPYDENGNLIRSYRWNEMYAAYASNPLYDATLGSFDRRNQKNISNNFSVDWKPLQGLIVRAQFGVTNNTNTTNRFVSPFNSRYDEKEYTTDEGKLRKGAYNFGTGEGYSYNGTLTVSYAATLAKKHQIYAGINLNASEDKNQNYTFAMEGFSTDNIVDFSTALGYAKNSTPGASYSFTRRFGFTGNANYSYDNRYYIDASYRVDGNSNYGSNKKWAPFWSAGIGWNIHNEKFLRSYVEKVGMLRLKASYGVTGAPNNSDGAYSIYNHITSPYYSWNPAVLGNLGNPNLTWQQTTEVNVGMEFSFFQNRIKGSFDWYNKKTDNLLSRMDLPGSTGFTSYSANVGAVENRGFELMLGGYVIRDRKKQFSWMMNGQLMYNHNEITKLSEDIKAQNEAYRELGVEVANLMEEGRPQYGIYAVRSLGVDPSTGKEVFLDRDGKVTNEWSAKDIVYLGQGDPAYRGIISNMVAWKGWTLNVGFSYNWGSKMYNSTLLDRVEVTTNQIKYGNVDRRVYENRWLKAGDITFFKAISNNETKATSRFVMDNRVLSLSTLSLQYRWEGASLKKILPMQSIIFSVNTSDLFYWSTIKVERGTNYPFARNVQGSVRFAF